MALTKIDLSNCTLNEYNDIHRWCTNAFDDNYKWHHQPSTNRYWLELTDEQVTVFSLKWL